MSRKRNLIISASPHITGWNTTERIMKEVCIALIPTVFASVYFFGFRSLLLIFFTVLFSVVFEYAWNHFLEKDQTIHDYSAIVTGLLLALNFPATLPLWMTFIGSFIAIIVVKMLFGGLGYNFANPAIVARIAMTLGYPASLTNYTYPNNTIDVFSSATPLGLDIESGHYLTLFLGNHGGVIGETSILALLLGGIYLIYQKIINPTIPFTYLATVFFMSSLCGEDPLYQILSGGLVMAAFFMATDYVTSPTTESGKFFYGIGLGILTCTIRFYGSMAEGVSFAVLIMNLLVPYIEIGTRNPVFGIKTQEKESKLEKRT